MYYPNQNPYGYNPQYQPQYGMGIPTMPKAKYTQPLTPEMISKLRSNGGAFKIEVSQEDLWRAACTHKENGHPTLVSEGVNPETGNEILRCTICGEVFEMVDYTKEQVQAIVNQMQNLLQTSKTVYLDAPEQLITQYYQMLPLLKLFPELYDRAQKNFGMYENALGVNPAPIAAGTNGFQMMGAMLSNPYAAVGYNPYGMPAQPAPMYGQPPVQQQPVYGQQPYNPNMGYGMPAQPAPMYGNPLMYNGGQPMAAPAPAPMTQAQAPGVVPPVQPDQGEVTQQKQFNV